MRSNKSYSFLKIATILTIVMMLSGCNLAKSLFSPVTELDFQKRPTYAVNKSLHLWKDLKKYEADIKVELKDINNNVTVGIENTAYHDENDSITGTFQMTDSKRGLSKIQARYLKDNTESFAIIERSNLTDETFRKLPLDTWLRFDYGEKTGNSLIDLITTQIGILDKEKFWQILKKADIFNVSTSKEGEINANPTYIYDIALNNDGLNELLTQLEGDFSDLLDIYGSSKLLSSIKNSDNSSGNIWIDKKGLFTRRIVFESKSSDGYMFSVEINVNPEAKKTTFEIPEYKEASSFLSDTTDPTDESVMDKLNEIIH